jgi:curved DNA-binding protein CbpA
MTNEPTREPDHYEVLQIRQDADPDVVEAAYERLAARYRDEASSNADAAEHLARLDAAFDVLRDPRMRAVYDAGLAHGTPPPTAPAAALTPPVGEARRVRVRSAAQVGTAAADTAVSGAWARQFEAAFPVIWMTALGVACLLAVDRAIVALP